MFDMLENRSTPNYQQGVVPVPHANSPSGNTDNNESLLVPIKSDKDVLVAENVQEESKHS